MQQIRNIDQANKILLTYVPRVKELLGKDITLNRMKPLMETLGNPQNKLNIIHVAGTSGKTSTCYYITELLRLTGKKIGLTVSPHIDSVTERVQINGKPISEEVFCEYLSEFISKIKTCKVKPTYFELLMAFAYWVFSQEKVDYAVIETGLGGLHDASNVADNSNKICVITDIGFDHTHILGNTITQIATQKAGIIYPKNQVFMHEQASEVMNVFSEVCLQQQSKLNVLSKVSMSSSLPEYQKRNWLLAEVTYCYLTKRDQLPSLTSDDLIKSTVVKIPARMDMSIIGSHTLVMDGAHNEQKMQAFVSSFKSLFNNQKADILLSFKEGKEFESVLPLLLPICSNLIITSFKSVQDTPFEAVNPEIIAISARKAGFDKIQVISNPAKAYQHLLISDQKLLIVTGSFYLISAIRKDKK